MFVVLSLSASKTECVIFVVVHVVITWILFAWMHTHTQRIYTLPITPPHRRLQHVCVAMSMWMHNTRTNSILCLLNDMLAIWHLCVDRMKLTKIPIALALDEAQTKRRMNLFNLQMRNNAERDEKNVVIHLIKIIIILNRISKTVQWGNVKVRAYNVLVCGIQHVF